MCYVCNNSPHTVSCPFYKNDARIKCAVCGSGIISEEPFYKLKEENFHTHCLRELNGIDIIEILEIKPNDAV